MDLTLTQRFFQRQGKGGRGPCREAMEMAAAPALTGGTGSPIMPPCRKAGWCWRSADGRWSRLEEPQEDVVLGRTRLRTSGQ